MCFNLEHADEPSAVLSKGHSKGQFKAVQRVGPRISAKTVPLLGKVRMDKPVLGLSVKFLRTSLGGGARREEQLNLSLLSLFPEKVTVLLHCSLESLVLASQSSVLGLKGAVDSSNNRDLCAGWPPQELEPDHPLKYRLLLKEIDSPDIYGR